MQTLMKPKLTPEETCFTKALGNSPTVRVLDLLIAGRELDYSLTDIEDGAEVGWTTLHEVIPELLKFDLIKHTRCVGRAKMYKLNAGSAIVKQLVGLYDLMLAAPAGEIFPKKLLHA